jgi:hypothetical protein
LPAIDAPADYPRVVTGPPGVKKRNVSTSAIVSGVLLTSAGVIGMVAGATAIALSKNAVQIFCDGPELCGHKDHDTRKTAGVLLMIGGVAASAAGIPLWAYGARQVRADGKPSHRDEDLKLRGGMLTIGPSGLSLRGDF